MKMYYIVKCFYFTKEKEHFHGFHIGVFDTKEKARQAIEAVIDQPSFCEHKDKIKIRKTIKIMQPKCLNQVFWGEGFTTYYY